MFTKIRSVLDVGCGSGQFSHLLLDKGIKEYYGIDFSQKRIEWARKNCPGFKFILADALNTDIFDTFHYDAVVCIEFLEHIEKDIDVITGIRSGARFYGSVPNFPYTSHVRHFTNSKQVCERYSKYFNDFSVTSLLADTKGGTFYLFEGIKT
jgi:SAM-dependent methyltransferase